MEAAILVSIFRTTAVKKRSLWLATCVPTCSNMFQHLTNPVIWLVQSVPKLFQHCSKIEGFRGQGWHANSWSVPNFFLLCNYWWIILTWHLSIFAVVKFVKTTFKTPKHIVTSSTTFLTTILQHVSIHDTTLLWFYFETGERKALRKQFLWLL